MKEQLKAPYIQSTMLNAVLTLKNKYMLNKT